MIEVRTQAELDRALAASGVTITGGVNIDPSTI